jgi:hypothetical protein
MNKEERSFYKAAQKAAKLARKRQEREPKPESGQGTERRTDVPGR